MEEYPLKIECFCFVPQHLSHFSLGLATTLFVIDFVGFVHRETIHFL